MNLHNGLVNVKVYAKQGNSAPAEIEVSERGNLGRLRPGTFLLLRFFLDTSSVDHVVPVTTNREKTWANELKQEVRFGELAYEFEVEVLRDGSVARDRHLVRLLVMTNKGLVSSKNVAVIVQKGEFYLATAETYRVQAFRNEHGKVAVPDLYNNEDGKGSFVGVRRFIEAHFVPQFSLPSILSYKQPVLPDVSSFTDEKMMVVQSWSLSNGTGVGLRKDGKMIKLHWSQVIVAERTPVFLFEGEIILAKSFCPVPNAKPGSLEIQATQMTRTEEMIAV